MSNTITMRTLLLRTPNATTGLLLLLVALLVVFALLLGDRLLNPDTFRSMAFQMPELGILSLAIMLPILCGGIDLSIISTANLSALLTAMVLTNVIVPAFGDASTLSLLALVVAPLVGAAIGALNGTLIAYLGVSPILVTLGTMIAVKGLGIGLSQGRVISNFPDPILAIGNGELFHIPIPLIAFALVAVPVLVLIQHTALGRNLALIGSNRSAVDYSGIDTRRILLAVYVLSGVIASIAGIVMMARFNSASAGYGESYLLVTILAVVLGGVDPMGGFGRVSGVVLALVILQLIATSFNIFGLNQFLTTAIWGGLLLLVAAIKAGYAMLGGFLIRTGER